MLKYKLNFRDTFPAAAVVKEGSSGLGMLPVELFLEMLCIERKRTERSGRKFVLMLLDPGALLQAGEAITEKLMKVVAHSTRETDLRGWYENRAILGVIFTEVGTGEEK